MRCFFVLVFILLLSPNSAFSNELNLEQRCTENTFENDGFTINTVAWSNSRNGDYYFCKIQGELEKRTSKIDGQVYSIGFEMRLPNHWNDRFLFQGNGGNDGRIVPATGGSANHAESALDRGFAVVSTNAGHQSKSLLGGAAFGLDPIARLNYGYQANEKLTPVAKAIIQTYYNKLPEFSYFQGCSNGGRHAMVAASRLSNEFDGFLAGNPGFNLPKAAIQHAWDIQWLSKLNEDISKSISSEKMQLLATAITNACDSLDGIRDGMVQATEACQGNFDLRSLQCSANNNHDASCIDSQSLDVIEKLFSGPTNNGGELLYSDWVFDYGVSASDWRRWKIHSPIADLPMIATLGAGSLATIFTTPPTEFEPTPNNFISFLREFDFEKDAKKISAVNSVYTESPMDFMTPPDVNRYSNLKESGGKLLVYHGASDGVFSVKDTINWYKALAASHSNKQIDFAKLYVVPGMNHCAGGPATDQFDMLTTLMQWAEEGEEPLAVNAQVNPRNTELPANWSKQRSRPLCPYPEVAVYNSGDKESSSSFACQLFQ